MIPGPSSSPPLAARFPPTAWATAVDNMARWGNKCLVLRSCCPMIRCCARGWYPSHRPVPISPSCSSVPKGCWALITEATLQVFPAPEAYALLVFTFPTFDHGFAAVLEMAAVGLQPALLELTEDFPVEKIAPSLIERYPGMSLYIGCEGFQELV
jgi:hypothetical protein